MASEALLGRQAAWPEGRYSTIAGFVEPGESLEDAVAREVLEETGVRVLEAEYHSSQPWPFPASLMIGFSATCCCDGDTASRRGTRGRALVQSARTSRRHARAAALAIGFIPADRRLVRRGRDVPLRDTQGRQLWDAKPR
jgi:NAD+ diphosphatase